MTLLRLTFGSLRGRSQDGLVSSGLLSIWPREAMRPNCGELLKPSVLAHPS